MKNILFINHSIRDGGPGRSLFYLLKHFDYELFKVNVLIPSKKIFSEKIQEEKLDVEQIVSAHFPENLKRQNFKINDKPISILPLDIIINIFRLFYLLFSMKKTLKEHKIDIIYSNGTLAKVFGALLGSYYKIDVIWHVRNIQQNFFLKFLINYFSSFTSVKKIICVSKSTQNQFKSKDKTIVINNGIDTEEYNSTTVSSILREKFNITRDKLIIGTAGRVVPRKNFEHFITVANEISNDYKKDCVFVLVGDTPYYFNQSYMKKLKKMVAELGLSDKFVFTGYTDKVESYISDFDLFIIPSKYEDPFPRVVIESMSLGKPILGYKIGGIGEVELIENSELRLKMSFESRKKAVNQYDSRIIASKIIDQIKLLSS